MSKRIHTAVALLGMTGVLAGCNVEQPSAGCQVLDATDAPWQAGYTLVSGTGTCAALKGEALGVFKYLDPASGVSRLAIRPEGAASLVTFLNADEEEVFRIPYDASKGSEGKKAAAQRATSLSTMLAAQPDASGLCEASGFAEARVEARAVTAAESPDGPLPAETVSYKYNSVQVYSAASAPGTQLRGTFTYSNGTGCTAEYKMVALWPQTSCKIADFNAPTDANAATRCAEGSGLNPDFDAKCAEANDGKYYCVPAKDVPSFR